MAYAHPFTPSDDDALRCGYIVSKPGGHFGAQTCGLPKSNARVHAPGTGTKAPGRHLSVVPAIAADAREVSA